MSIAPLLFVTNKYLLLFTTDRRGEIVRVEELECEIVRSSKKYQMRQI